MNKRIILYLLAAALLSLPAIAQPDNQAQSDTALLGLPGDNLDLYATLDLFQKSKTIEDFEKSLNLKETGINNLDLNLDGNVDFIKVVTKQEGTNFTFILQDDISEKEVQDVAVILLSKDKDGKVTLQIVGDKDLYGKDYVIEPKPAAPTVTPNPAYTGTDPVPATAATTTTVVVVESAPVVQYVYSPVYVPYVPPYYYGYYPPYHAAFRVVAVSTYHHNHYYHGGYHGGHGNTVIIHNENNYNNYNNSRHSSNTVTQHNANGNYNSNRSSAGTTQAGSSSARPSTNQSAGQSKGTSATTNASNNKSKGSASATNQSASKSKSSSAKPQTSSTRSSRSMGGRRR